MIYCVTSTKEENVGSNSCHQQVMEAGCRSGGGRRVCCHPGLGGNYGAAVYLCHRPQQVAWEASGEMGRAHVKSTNE